MVNNTTPINQYNIPLNQRNLSNISPTATIQDINDATDSEESKTQELMPQINEHVNLNDTYPLGDFTTLFTRTNRYETLQYYDLDALRLFQEDTNLVSLPNEQQMKSDLIWIDSGKIINKNKKDYYYRWMDILVNLEKQLKAILMNRVENTQEIPNYLGRSLVSFLTSIMSKLFLSEQYLKLQSYWNEILLLCQKVALTLMMTYPQQCLGILKKIFASLNEHFYDSRFYENQIIPAIQLFYAERQYMLVTSQHQGYLRTNYPYQSNQNNNYNTHIYYPLQREILSDQYFIIYQQSKLAQNSFSYSPFQRIQIHRFYQTLGFDTLIQMITSCEVSLQNLLGALEVISALKPNINSQMYVGLVLQLNDALLMFPQRVSEEELKVATREQFQALISSIRTVLQPLYKEMDLNKHLGLIELRLILLCFRSINLEKRIYGLQQFNEKINEALTNDYMANNNNMQNGVIKINLIIQWMVMSNILSFIVENQVFEDIFGEKGHLELIKRSVPMVRFLYQQHKLGVNGVIHLMKLVQGKHEAWVSQIYKILNELAELLIPQDLEAVLNDLEWNNLDPITLNCTLNFICSFGRNPIFERSEKRVLNKIRRGNNVLDDMDLESAQQRQQVAQREENISDLISYDNLRIKVHSNSGQETELNTYYQPKNEQKQRAPGQRHYAGTNNKNHNYIQQNEEYFDDCGEADASDELGIRLSGYILDRLYEWMGIASTVEVSNAVSTILLELLCKKFKFHRFTYLIKSLNTLSSAEWELKPTAHLQMVLKIIQSEYPILNSNELVLVKQVGDMAKWVEHQYNIKMSIVGWISRLKKNCVEMLFAQQHRDELIINSYLTELEGLLLFYSCFYQLADGLQRIDQVQLKLLWQVIVENAINTNEQNAFFNWLHGTMKINQKHQRPCVLTPESIQLAFFEYIVKIDQSSYTIPMFNCLHDFILHFNITYKLLKPLGDSDSFVLMSHELIGSEVVWHLFFESADAIIAQKAEELLLDLMRMRHNSQDVHNELKARYTMRLMQNVQEKSHVGDLNSVKRCLSLLVKLLEELEGLRVMGRGSNGGERGEKITVTLDNKIKGVLPPKKQEVVLWTNMTVQQAKQQIAQRLNPTLRPEEFDLVTRGNWLSDTKTLRDYRLESKLTIMVYNRANEEPTKSEAIPLGPPNKDEQNAVGMNLEKVTIDPAQLEEKVGTVCDFTGETNKDLIRYVLEQKNYNEQDAIEDLIDEGKKDQYLIEFQSKAVTVTQQQQGVRAIKQKSDSGQLSVSTLLSENTNHMSTFFQILQKGDIIICRTVWQILSLIPRNRQTYLAVDHRLHVLSQSNEIDQQNGDEYVSDSTWESLLDPNNSHRLLYNIQILKEMLECDIAEEANEELRHRKEGRERFLLNQGFKRIVQLLMSQSIKKPLQEDLDGSNEYSQLQASLVSILLEIYQIYSNAYVLARCDQKKPQLMRLINLPETLREIYRSLESQQSASYFLGGVLSESPANGVVGVSASQKSVPRQFSSPSNSQSVSSAVTPNFQSLGATPRNILTPPDGDTISISKGSQQPSNQNRPNVDEFKQLVNSFTNDRGLQQVFEDSHQQGLFAGGVVRYCLQIVQNFANVQSEEAQHVLEQAVSLMLSLLYHDGSLISTLYENEVFQVFLTILLGSPNEELRRMVAFTVMTVCEMVNDQERFNLVPEEPLQTQSQYADDELFNNERIVLLDPRIFFLRSYVPLIEECEDERIRKCESDDLFVVVTNLLLSLPAETLQSLVHFERLFDRVAEYIISRPFVEERFDEKEDKVLQGYLLLLTTILEVQPQFKKRMMENQFLQKIYDFLFYMPSIEKVDTLQAKQSLLKYPKCKRKLTRKRAFSLLTEACKNNEENFITLLKPIVKNHEQFDHSNADATGQVKGAHGYVGLKNLGCTCYINSLIQQLFMMRSLRSAVLNSHISLPNPHKHKNTLPAPVLSTLDALFPNKEQDLLVFKDIRIFDTKPILYKLMKDNTLYQLQILFASLQESVKQFFIPNNFISSIKGYDGQPINCLLQQDVNEFFNLLTDKMETHLKGTQNHDILQKTMGGTLGHTIVSLEEEYPFERETEEPFLTVTIEIKNKRSLEESLDLFVKGDILDGQNQYYCEQYDKKINAAKRCYFKKLPHTLVLTLKRFEFDYNSMLRVKVNDYFEFPQEISLFKWSKDGMFGQDQQFNADDYMYKLVGVLVHSGCAEGGHYYSFIKDRQTTQWFQFNDHQIYPFNLINLKNECFGGKGNGQVDNLDWDSNNLTKNAYLLFYEREQKSEVMQEEEGFQNEHALLEGVWNENLIYLRNLLFYSADYLCFVRDFICQFKFPDTVEVTSFISNSEEMLSMMSAQENLNDIESINYYKKTPAMNVIKLMTLFSYETLIKNSDVQGFVNSMQTIQTLYDKFAPSAFWLLGYVTQNKQMLIDLLIESSYVEVKHHFAKLLTICISQVMKTEENYLLDEVSLDSETFQVKYKYKRSCLIRFLDIYIDDLFTVAKKNLRRSTEYFQVIRFAIAQSPKLISLAKDNGLLKNFHSLFVDTLRENQSNFPLTISKLNEKGLESPIVALFEVIAKIIQGFITTGMTNLNEDSPVYLFKPFKQNAPYFDKNFLSIILQYDHYKLYFAPMMQLTNTVVDITRHLCWGDSDISKRIIKQLVILILDYFIKWQDTDPVFHLIDSIVKLNDQYQNDRIEMVFGQVQDTVIKGNSLVDAIRKQQYSDKNYSINCIKWIAEIGSNCQPFGNYMLQNYSTFKEMLMILRQHKTYPNSNSLHMGGPSLLPNIINKSIIQLETILQIDKEDWNQTDNQVIEEEEKIQAEDHHIPQDFFDDINQIVLMNKKQYDNNDDNNKNKKLQPSQPLNEYEENLLQSDDLEIQSYNSKESKQVNISDEKESDFFDMYGNDKFSNEAYNKNMSWDTI